MKKFHNTLKLLTWNNQSYPIGSYSFSSGLEYAVEINIINSSLESETNRCKHLVPSLSELANIFSDLLDDRSTDQILP